MKLELDLPDIQADRLRAEAQRLGVAPQELAVAAIVDLLGRLEDDFSKVAQAITSRATAAEDMAELRRLSAEGKGRSGGWKFQRDEIHDLS